MECRHLLVVATAVLLLVAGARVRAGEVDAPRVLHVAGGDFPALVMVVPDEHAVHGLQAPPTCERIRARRVDELAPGWRTRVSRIELDCEDTLADDAKESLTAVTARALLQHTEMAPTDSWVMFSISGRI